MVLVGGGLDDGSENAPLATALASGFTAFNYARRGRGESGDTPPFAVEREIEDVAALVAEAGGTAHLYGVSSGGMLALEAAIAGLPIERLAVYDVPYDSAADADARYGGPPWSRPAAAVPRSERLTSAGAGHSVDPQAMAAALERFFGAGGLGEAEPG